MNLWRKLFGKERKPITAKSQRAVRFVAECMAFHFTGKIDGWKAYIGDAEKAIVGYSACKFMDHDVYTQRYMNDIE